MNDQVCTATPETPAMPLPRPCRMTARKRAGGPPVAGAVAPGNDVFALLLACLAGSAGDHARAVGNDSSMVSPPVETCKALSGVPAPEARGAQVSCTGSLPVEVVPTLDPGATIPDAAASLPVLPDPGVRAGAGDPDGAVRLGGGDMPAVRAPATALRSEAAAPSEAARRAGTAEKRPAHGARVQLQGLARPGSRNETGHGPGDQGQTSGGVAPPARGSAAIAMPGRVPEEAQEALRSAFPGLPPGMSPATGPQGRGEGAKGLMGSGEAAARVARAMRAAETARALGPPEIRMVMEPENLGNVHLRLTSAPRGLVASFRVHSEAALGVLRQGIGNLTQELARAGVPVGHMSVAMSLGWTGRDTGRNSGWNERGPAQPGVGTGPGMQGGVAAPAAGVAAACSSPATLLDMIA